MKVIIVEDEPLARMGLTGYVEDVDFLHLCQACEDAAEANNAIHKYEPDLMFLDIQMPRLTGIDFLKSLTNPPMVIFTTAYPNYALQGFELNVVDYLVKPYPFDRFLKAVNKARDLYQLKNKQATDRSPERSDHFFIKVDHKLERINFKDIHYIEALENYIVIHSTDGKRITMMTMKSVEDELTAHNFLRIHKSFIVNIDHVKSIEGNELRVGDVKLPFSRQKKQEVLDRILKRN